VKIQGFKASKKQFAVRSAKKRTWFIKPFRSVLIDYIIFFSFNVILIHILLLLLHDPMVVVFGVLWVGIIAWRGGILAGLIGSILISFSISIGLIMAPEGITRMPYYFNNKVPGVIFGLIQYIVISLVVGYISTLVHQLRKEIQLRINIQKQLECKIAELDAFGHTVAHDLKNPLMVINVSIDGLIREFGSSGSAKAAKMLEFISDGTKQMINIIESLLMLAGVKKINQKDFEVFPSDVSVNDALKRLEYLIEANNVKIEKPDYWPSVYGYAPWITEIWANYINNAIKYGGKPAEHIQPSIELGYDIPNNTNKKTEFIRFWVKDNGTGIAKEKIPTLFKEFSRLDNTTGKEGHGLGLSIVKLIVARFNGEVGVESELGKGSLFYFTLPVKKMEDVHTDIRSEKKSNKTVTKQNHYKKDALVNEGVSS
jgi:signal transduction histidine kinase